MSEHPLTILGLEAENIRKIKAIMIHPAAVGVVKICGGNAQGKSSVLDCVQLALSRRTTDVDVPIRTGEDKAKIGLDLGEFQVIRTFTAKGDYLTVQRKDGKLARPQDFLDRLITGGLGFDPLAFANQDSAIQVSALLDLLKLPEDPRRLDEQKGELYANRRDVNREIKALQAQAAGLPGPNETVPRKLVSVEALMQEHARLRNLQKEDEALTQSMNSVRGQMDQVDARIARIMGELEAARAERVEVGQRLADLQDMVPHNVSAALTEVENQIRTAESVNAKVREAQRYDELAETILGKEMEAIGLTSQMDALEARKLQILSEAPFPVPGLGFSQIAGEYRVTFNGIPLAECASSERLRVGMAIAMATNPTVRVILIREGSLLDQQSLAAVQEAATANGYQIWVELVGEDGADAFVIQDGGLLKPTESAGA